MTLLDKAEKNDYINLFFEADVKSVDINSSTLTLNINGHETTKSYDVIFGSDGAGSAIRRTIQKNGSRLRFDFQQKWLSTGYKELHIPPTSAGGWKIEKHALHIWPRKGHMMIALPNLDGSFTLTMFTPFEGPVGMNRLDTDELITEFMEENFADAIKWGRLSIQMHAKAPIRRALMVACCAYTGNLEEAANHADELKIFSPDFIPTILRGDLLLYRDSAHNNLLIEGLRKAGLHE